MIEQVRRLIRKKTIDEGTHISLDFSNSCYLPSFCRKWRTLKRKNGKQFQALPSCKYPLAGQWRRSSKLQSPAHYSTRSKKYKWLTVQLNTISDGPTSASSCPWKFHTSLYSTLHAEIVHINEKMDNLPLDWRDVKQAHCVHQKLSQRLTHKLTFISLKTLCWSRTVNLQSVACMLINRPSSKYDVYSHT